MLLHLSYYTQRRSSRHNLSGAALENDTFSLQALLIQSNTLLIHSSIWIALIKICFARGKNGNQITYNQNLNTNVELFQKSPYHLWKNWTTYKIHIPENAAVLSALKWTLMIGCSLENRSQQMTRKYIQYAQFYAPITRSDTVYVYTSILGLYLILPVCEIVEWKPSKFVSVLKNNVSWLFEYLLIAIMYFLLYFKVLINDGQRSLISSL